MILSNLDKAISDYNEADPARANREADQGRPIKGGGADDENSDGDQAEVNTDRQRWRKS
jgi:hypothetical protein